MRRALELAATVSLVLGPQHWTVACLHRINDQAIKLRLHRMLHLHLLFQFLKRKVHWARLLVVDLYISKMSACLGAFVVKPI